MNLSASPAFHPYRPAAWLRVSGADAPGFLQGQFTNDLSGLEAHQAVYGLWLDHKGKLFADSFVIGAATSGEFWIGSYFCPGETLRQRLENFIIADDVIVEDVTAQWRGIAVVGEGSRARLPAGAPPEGVIFQGRRCAAEAWEWVVPESAAPALSAACAGMSALTADGMEGLRIEAGIPAVSRDLGAGDLPNEGGLDESAISYTKGCYLGQEVMARLKLRGRLRRRLTRVRGAEAAPALPAPLWQEDRAVGELRSAAPAGSAEGFVGLAMLTLASFRPEAPLAFSAGGAAAAQAYPIS